MNDREIRITILLSHYFTNIDTIIRVFIYRGINKIFREQYFDDIMQNFYLHLLKRINRDPYSLTKIDSATGIIIADEPHFTKLCMKIAFRRICDYCNDAKRWKTRFGQTELTGITLAEAPLTENPATQAEIVERGNLVRDALDKLPVNQKIAVLLDAQGYLNREIADIMSCPIGTVGVRIQRGLQKLEELLREKFSTGNL